MVKAVTGKIEAEVLNQNFSELDSKEVSASDLSPALKEEIAQGKIPFVGPNTVGNIEVKPKSISADRTDFLEIGKNIFNKANVTLNYDMTHDGVIHERPGYFYSVAIHIDGATDYVESIVGDGLYVTFKDKDNKFISGIVAGYPPQDRTYKTPINAQYKIVSGQVKHLDSLQIEKGTVSTGYELYKASAIGFTAEDPRMDNVESLGISNNLLSGEWIVGEGLDNQTGLPITVANLKRMPAIKVKPLQTYTLSGVNIQGINIAEYDDTNKLTNFQGKSSDTITFTTKQTTSLAAVVVTFNAEDVQLELGSFATQYKAANIMENLKVPYLEKEIDELRKESNASFNPKKIVNRSELSLKTLNPSLYLAIKKPSKDMVIKKVQDSIGVSSQGYQSDRKDAPNRPPMCEQKSEFSMMCEMLLPKGQRYYRYDSGIFTETAAEKETKSYDDFWDWVKIKGSTTAATNNRPALTRVLNSDAGQSSLSYTIPIDAVRCDYIYRTDCKNADTVTISISKGNGVVQVFDITTQSYVEANGYLFSQKEADTLINADVSKTQGKVSLRKSVYQATLKMQCFNNDGTVKVTLTNNGPGRLTFWGIQTSPLTFMTDIKNVSRGGHNIYELSMFEEWDVDMDKPGLILTGNPMINEGINISNNGVPVAWQVSPTNYAKRFVDWCKKYKDKAYKPQIINFSYLFNADSGAIDKIANKLNFAKFTQYKFDIDNIFAEIEKQMSESSITHINIFDYAMEEVKAKSELENKNWYDAIWKGFDFTPENASLTYDSTHPNDLGAQLYFEITRNLYR